MKPEPAARSLLRWFDAHRRTLPWRAPPGRAADPYAVYLSEIMLQQTTVASVVRFFNRFISRWPTVEALAAAPLEEVLAAWAGLGYYARARNLHACAKLVAERYGGRFPRSERELLELPGVGPYTAAAIAAIAFGEPCVAADGNVERVMTRLFAIPEPSLSAKPAVRAAAQRLLPRNRPGDYLQALMDLGASVCTPRAPDCAACPLAQDCAALRLGTPTAFPVKPRKPERPRRRGAAFVLTAGDRVLLRRRPEEGLLGGMSEFPTTPLDGDFAGLGEGDGGAPARLAAVLVYAPARAAWRELPGPVRHVFTHFSLELTVFVARAPSAVAIPGCRWVQTAELSKEALPSVMRKAALRAGLSLS